MFRVIDLRLLSRTGMVTVPEVPRRFDRGATGPRRADARGPPGRNRSRPGGLQINLLSAAAILVSLPVIVLSFVFQRQLVRGILSGSVKG